MVQLDGRLLGCGMVTALLVEDDHHIRESLSMSLTDLGYSVVSSGTAISAFELMVKSNVDVVLLDLGLPDMDGSTLLSMIRSVSPVPVLVLTARVGNDQIVKLLNLGADDYVTKPFDVDQLDARIRAVLRRSDRVVPTITVGQLHIDTRQRTVTIDDRPVPLRNLEYQLLLALALSPGEPISSTALASRLWGDGADNAARLDVHLSWLRTALGESARRPKYIERIRGVGIRLAAPDR
jgi:DNA-binding response OmpR family regulator